MTRRGGARRRPGTVGAVLAAVTVVAVVLSGCTAARDTLGTTTSPCFRALPLAKRAVHGRGSFAGVRLVSSSELNKLRHLKGTIDARSPTAVHDVCLIGYRGTYRSDQVARPAGRLPASEVGHFVVVVVSSPQNVLLATILLDKEPLRFRHLALGPPLTARAPPRPSGA